MVLEFIGLCRLLTLTGTGFVMELALLVMCPYGTSHVSVWHTVRPDHTNARVATPGPMGLRVISWAPAPVERSFWAMFQPYVLIFRYREERDQDTRYKIQETKYKIFIYARQVRGRQVRHVSYSPGKTVRARVRQFLPV